MPAVMLVGQGLAETLVDAIRAVTVTARVTTAANVVLWTGAISAVDSSETDGLFSISTASAAASATGTPAKVKFYDGSSNYAWQTTIGNGGGFAFQFTGDLTSGNSYNFTSSQVGYTITAENG